MFTESCFCRIEDAEKRKEVTTRLNEFGYDCVYDGSENDNLISCLDGKYAIDYKSHPGCKYNCGTNDQLFLALAALRDDSDYMQWFTNGRDWELWNVPMGSEYINLFTNGMRKATPSELIEHFKT